MIWSAIIGLLGSGFPHILDFFKTWQDNKQELAILDRQAALQASGAAQKLAEINAQADIAESQALYKTYATNITWVDALNGTVRPVIMYSFFLLYAVVKFCQYHTLMSTIATPLDALGIVWKEADMEIFCTCLTFYFGNRTFNKMREGK